MSSDHGPRLRALILAAEALTAACEEDMAGPNTDQFTDDEAVGISDSPTGDTAVTFGMIRRTRAALDALLRASASALPPERAQLQPEDYALIAEAVNDFLGYDITTREQQDRITRWAAASALPEKLIRAHQLGCPRAFSVTIDVCACGGRDVAPEQVPSAPEPAIEDVVGSVDFVDATVKEILDDLRGPQDTEQP